MENQHQAKLTVTAPNGDELICYGTKMDMMTLDAMIKKASTARVCNTCGGEGIVRGLHDWSKGGTREQACWNCSPAKPVDPVYLRIQELYRLISDAGDRRDWLGCDEYQRELDFLLGDKPSNSL